MGTLHDFTDLLFIGTGAWFLGCAWAASFFREELRHATELTLTGVIAFLVLIMIHLLTT